MDYVSNSIKHLSACITAELEKLSANNQHPEHYTDSLVYLGNWQDSIPRSIWFDTLLEAIDVRSWGLIRTQVTPESAMMLSLNQLLRDALGYSKPTVSRIIYVLRLTRWISLCSRLRDANGRFKGHIYAIHDNVISLTDAIYLDADYIGFVKAQTHHGKEQIRTVALKIWANIQDSIDKQETDFVVSAAENITKFSTQKSGNQVNYFNPVKKHQVIIFNLDDRNPEIPRNQQLDHQVNKVNPIPICSSSKKTTTTKTKSIEKEISKNDFIFPEDFNASERELALLLLQKIEPEFRQPFLDEVAAQMAAKRKTHKPVKNPIAYLCWLCNEHRNGNTLLSSLGVRHRDNRARQADIKRKIEMDKNNLMTLSKQPKKPIRKISSSTQIRWDKSSVKPKAKNLVDGSA
jgi:hypothetical protein